MLNQDILSEFNTAQIQMNNCINDLSSNIVLAYDKSKTSMISSKDVSKHLEVSSQLLSKISSNFIGMISAFNKAYASIQNNISSSVEGLTELICDNDDKLKLIYSQLQQLAESVTYKNPSTDYTTIAKFMIDNVKLDDRTSIRGKSITIKTLALILMKYDEIRRNQES